MGKRNGRTYARPVWNSVRAASAAVAAIAVGTAAAAGSATGSLAVSASIANNCTVSTSAVAFGAYDPIGANSSAGADVLGSGAITVNCTKNAGTGGGNAVSIALSFGQNAAASPRKMKNASLDLLSYDLYIPALAAGEYTDCSALTTVWGTTTPNVLQPASSFWQGTPHSVSVCGKITKGQTTASVGSYSDTVTVTVSF